MLGVYWLAFCLSPLAVTASTLVNKRQAGNAYPDDHPAARRSREFNNRGRSVIASRESPNTRPSVQCQPGLQNTNDNCGPTTPAGGTFLTDLEGGPLGPGFPPKPVGLQARPNATREEPSTPAPEGRFLIDGAPPMPPPPLRRRPLPKGFARARNHLPQSGEDSQRESEEDPTPIRSGPLFYEDLPTPDSSRQSGESRERSSENSAEVSQNEGDRENSIESDEKPIDSFSGLDQPDPTLSQPNKNREPERSNEIDNSRPEDVEEEPQRNFEQLEDDRKTTAEEEEDDRSTTAEEGGVGNNVESNEEAPNTGHSGEEESENPENSAEQEEQSREEELPNPDQSDADEGPDSESIREEERPEPPNSEEEEQERPHSNLPVQETGQHERPIPQHSLEDNGANLSHSAEEEGPDDAPSSEGDVENQTEEEAHSDEDQPSEEEEERPYSDYSEETNGINSSGQYIDYEDGPYQQQSEEGPSGESVEGAQKPAPSLENASEESPHSAESVEGPPQEDYDSGEQRPPYREYPQKPSNEYDDDERQPDYYDLPDYDYLSPEPEYEDGYGRPEGQGKRPQSVNYIRRPPLLYYVVGGSNREQQEPNKNPDFAVSSPKPPDFVLSSPKPPEFEDNRLKPSEEIDNSTPSAEEEPSSEENFNFGFDSFEFDADLMKTPSPLKNNKNKAGGGISSSTPQSTTKYDDYDETMSTAGPIDLKRLRKPLGTAKPKPPQLGDVVSFTRARPLLLRVSPPTRPTTTARPATISALGIVKPGGSIIAKVVSPTLQVHSSTAASTKADDAQVEAPVKPSQAPWRTLLAAREATALTYLKPPPLGQAQTWFLRQPRTARLFDSLARPL